MAMDEQKSLLVLINPYSGTKLASKLFRTVVKPELDQRRLLYEVLETEYAGKIALCTIFTLLTLWNSEEKNGLLIKLFCFSSDFDETWWNCSTHG